MRPARATAIVGLLLILGTLGGGALLAPAMAAPSSESVLVGVQGPAMNGKVASVGGEDEWTLANAGSYHGVQPLENGSILAAYVVGGEQDCGQFEPPCGRTGVRIIQPNPEPHVVWQWSYPVRSVGNSEVHDVEMLPSGNILIADMEYESIFILNPKTEKRVWTWNASKFYEAPTDPTTTDWLHINDVDRIGEGRYLVSVRNANQIVIVERGKGVVEVINKDGKTDILRGQHNPQWLGNGAVLVADSGNDRVVELHKQNGEWKPAWSIRMANGTEFSWPRDADRLPNGHTLITDSRNHRVVEVTRSGDVVQAWRTPKLPYEADIAGGERAGGEIYNQNSFVPAGTDEGHIPVAREVYIALQHSVGLPFWLDQLHVGILLIGTWLSICGGITEGLEVLR